MEEFNVDFSVTNSSFDANFGNVIKGDKGEPGKDGTVSFDNLTDEQKASLKGEPGTSVTITDIKESTKDGGENVVTFSDGSTLRVKNGSSGGGTEDEPELPTVTEADNGKVLQVVDGEWQPTELAVYNGEYEAVT